jgi:peptidoglycan/LPS O-acetylase OafA/YrhL
MQLDPAVSRKLRALSLLGIAMVVVGHAPSYRDPSAPSVRSIPYSVVERLFTDALPRIVVMMFFAISGFLLLWGHDGSWATHRRKIAARTRSLLVPYLTWSLLGILVYLLLQSLPWTAPWFANSARSLVGRSAGELLLVWLFDPIPYQLWFLRDLWLMVVVSPLLLWSLQRFGGCAVLALAVPHALGVVVPGPVPDKPLLTGDTYFWFAVGGLFAVRRLPLVFAPSAAPWWLGATLLVACARAWVLAHATWPVTAPLATTPDLYWFKAVHFVGVPSLWLVYDRWLTWMERPFWLRISNYAFFVFVAHEPLLTMVRKPLVRWFGTGDAAHAAEFACTLGGTLLIVLTAGVLLRRALPRVFAFLCGGRGA